MGPRALLALLRRFGRDRAGAAAVEFALVFPVLLLVYLGSVETTRFVMAKQKAVEASATIADLVTRTREVDAAGLDKLIGFASDMMIPFPSAPLMIRISAVQQQVDPGTGQAVAPTVVWYRSTRLENQQKNALPMPTAADLAKILDAGSAHSDFVIVVEVFYRYQPLTTKALDLPLDMYERSVLRPRLSETITCDDCDTQ